MSWVDDMTSAPFGPTSASAQFGRERRVRLVRTAVGRRCDMGSLRESFGRISPVCDHRVGSLGRAHALEQVGIARQRRTFLPRHFECLRGLDGIPLALRNDTDEVALAHDPSRDVLDRALVDAQGLRAGAIGALPGWAHDPAMQHVRHAHVLHVQVCSTCLGRNIDARHLGANKLVAIDRLLRRSARELDVERLVADQRAVGDRLGRVAVDRHDALRHHKASGLYTEPRRGERQQRLPGLGRRRAHLRPAAVN